MNEKDLENEDKRKYMEGRIPLGRTGVTEDMVGPAIFLASEMSQYVVGQPRVLGGYCAYLLRLEHNYSSMAACLSICSERALSHIYLRSGRLGCGEILYYQTHP